MSRNARIVILCEDVQHETFCRRMLTGMGFSNRQFVVKRGGGATFVDREFGNEAEAQRRRNSHTETGLIALRDADNLSVQERLRGFAGKLARPRDAHEKIALLIPKWEIETWIEHLQTGQEVDEARSDYPKLRGHERDCRPAVDRFLEIAQGANIPANCPASLRRVLTDEYPRLANLRP